ncbi:MAG: C40 family peptidase [Nocardioides sp.]|uniref:C40 family peptidase n=1 Tax=Nocardioides sp. TaxID=35761 RepID=UPI003F03B2CB
MPAIRRAAHSCALVLVAVATLLVPALGTATAHASEPSTDLLASGAGEVDTIPTTSKTKVHRVTAKERVNRKVLAAVKVAKRQRGDAYRYGAAGPDAFDCSGLIYYSYRKAGLGVPRTSGSQAGHVRRVAKKNLRVGDLMFFHSGGSVYHAGIFMGRTKGGVQMLHAPSTGRSVTIEKPWTSSWFGGTLRRR